MHCNFFCLPVTRQCLQAVVFTAGYKIKFHLAGLAYLCRNNWVSLFPGCHSMGFLEKMVLDAEQLAAINELIPGAAVNTQESFKFRKINYWNQIFYSTSCSKVTKRNSYTVVFVGKDGNLKVGMILYYLKLVLRNAHPYYLAAIQELHPYPEAGIMAGIDVTTLNNNLAGHLKPFCFPRFVQFAPVGYQTTFKQ